MLTDSRTHQHIVKSRVKSFRLSAFHWKQAQAGGDGLGAWTHRARQLSLIHSIAEEQDGEVWEHISVSRFDGTMPTWLEVRNTFREVAGPDATGLIIIPPVSRHVNIGEVAHVWHCLTKSDVVPDFTRGGRMI